MNQARRKELAKVFEKLEEVKAAIELVKEEEDFSFDQLPESLQNSDKGRAMEDTSDALERSLEDIESIIESLTEACGV